MRRIATAVAALATAGMLTAASATGAHAQQRASYPSRLADSVAATTGTATGGTTAHRGGRKRLHLAPGTATRRPGTHRHHRRHSRLFD
jgi:hypothetical protein